MDRSSWDGKGSAHHPPTLPSIIEGQPATNLMASHSSSWASELERALHGGAARPGSSSHPHIRTVGVSSWGAGGHTSPTQ